MMPNWKDDEVQPSYVDIPSTSPVVKPRTSPPELPAELPEGHPVGEDAEVESLDYAPTTPVASPQEDPGEPDPSPDTKKQKLDDQEADPSMVEPATKC